MVVQVGVRGFRHNVLVPLGSVAKVRNDRIELSGIPAVDAMAGDVATGSGSVIGADRRAPSSAEASALEIGEAILVGPGAMPVFVDFSGQDLNDVAAYVGVLQEQGTTTPRGLGGAHAVAQAVG